MNISQINTIFTIVHPNGNCSSNPQCLKGFGENREGIWIINNKNEKDPSELLRKPDSFVGLAVSYF